MHGARSSDSKFGCFTILTGIGVQSLVRICSAVQSLVRMCSAQWPITHFFVPPLQAETRQGVPDVALIRVYLVHTLQEKEQLLGSSVRMMAAYEPYITLLLTAFVIPDIADDPCDPVAMMRSVNNLKECRQAAFELDVRGVGVGGAGERVGRETNCMGQYTQLNASSCHSIHHWHERTYK